MSFQISTSLNQDDYEVMIRRRGEFEYASYCPQLNLMLTGSFHEEVENLMHEKIAQHIAKLKSSNLANPSLN